METHYKQLDLRKAIHAHSVVALRLHEVLLGCEFLVTEKKGWCRLVPSGISQRDLRKSVIKL